MGPGREFLENIAEIGEGIDTVQFTGLNQGINGGGALATGVIAGEEEVFSIMPSLA